MCDQDQTSLECLQNILDETQETIRAYDTKAEIFAVILTIFVGVINFGMVSEAGKAHCWINTMSLFSMGIGVVSLFVVGMVLWPRKNPFQGIETGDNKPKGTYYFLLNNTTAFKNLDGFLAKIDATDWKRELAYEVLKASCIRDKKHFWFCWALKCAALSLLCVALILVGVGYYGW